ncbi:MAG: O-antigen ligase family protein, partial [Bacteroidia bacterium]
MLDIKNIKWVYALSIAFILINALCTYFEFYYFNLVPAAILIVLLALFSLDKLVLLVVFLTPLAINLQHIEGGFGLSLPTEPIIFGIMLIFIFKQLHHNTLDARMMKHPITIAIIINLVWILVTCITSDIPVVSFKFLVSRLWFVIVFYFVGTQLFKKYSNIKIFNWLYIISFTIIILYTLYNHALVNFDEHIANYIMSPFYNDHTVYGAMLAMFLPVLIFYMFNKKYSSSIRFGAALFFIVFVIALIFSYTRAAWVSLAVAIVVYFILLLRIKFRTIMIAFFALVIYALYNQTEIKMSLERNRQDASQDFDK